MATYWQRIRVAEIQDAMKSQQSLRDEAENQRKASMSAEECYQVGFERGIEDKADGYMGAIERTTLGDDYAYPEKYREGYRNAFYS